MARESKTVFLQARYLVAWSTLSQSNLATYQAVCNYSEGHWVHWLCCVWGVDLNNKGVASTVIALLLYILNTNFVSRLLWHHNITKQTKPQITLNESKPGIKLSALCLCNVFCLLRRLWHTMQSHWKQIAAFGGLGLNCFWADQDALDEK